MHKKIPVVLVSGFLGAGKTTLVQRLVQESARRGLRAGLIINEFGMADIDADILRSASAELMSSVTGGCACCAGQDEFLLALLEMSRRAPEERPDVILVESSGLADPVLMLDALTIAGLLPVLRVASVVCVIDTARFLLMADETGFDAMPLLLRQIKLADLIILNKTDIVYRAEHRNAALLDEVRDALREANPLARLESAKGCAVDLQPLWERVARAGEEIPRGDSGPQAPHAHYQTVVFTALRTFERAELEALLGALEPQVWRAKGFVRLRGQEALALVQYAGGTEPLWDIEPFALPPSSTRKITPAMVFIGPQLNAEGLRQRFCAPRLALL